METLFWGSLGLIAYAYLGYPFCLLFLSAIRSREVRKGPIAPTVTFIITAHNEEDRIEPKIINTLDQDYPPGKLEILVASDCSTDGTDAIVRSYEARGVRLVRLPERKGKEAAQKAALDASSAEVIVFSDVATALDKDGISNIVTNFGDPSVGCVSSVDRFMDADGKVSGEGAYVRYEMWLRRLETKVNTIVGLSGSFFAARREICLDWATDLQSDFNTLLNAVKAGLRGVSDESSIGYYKNLADERKEFDRKVRTVLRGISVFMKSVSMLNPLTFRLFAWQLLSHKLCRWLVPFCMCAVLVANLFLANQSYFYAITLAIQLAAYAAAIGGILLGPSKHTALRIPAFLVMANWSILTAWYKYLRGQRVVSWQSSRRPSS